MSFPVLEFTAAELIEFCETQTDPIDMTDPNTWLLARFLSRDDSRKHVSCGRMFAMWREGDEGVTFDIPLWFGAAEEGDFLDHIYSIRTTWEPAELAEELRTWSQQHSIA